MFDLDHDLALRVFADRYAMHVEIAALDRDAGELLDGEEDGIDRPVAAVLFRRVVLVAMAEP